MAEQQRRCYVYRIFDGHETVYIGKGTGRRLQTQLRRFGVDGEILARDLTDEQAFRRERELIAELMPTANRHPGGNGGRSVKKRKPSLPLWWRKQQREMQELGTRKYVARFLARKLNYANCELYGISKVGMDRLLEVANGPRC
jgi:hypothetical protein